MQCLHQETARCLSDEAAIIGMHRPGRVWEREVLLRCDDRPAVFGHTVVPMSATATRLAPVFRAGRAFAGHDPVWRPAWCAAVNWNLPACAPATRWCSGRRRRWRWKGGAPMTSAVFCAPLPVSASPGLAAGNRSIFAGGAGVDVRHSHRCNRHINKQSITMNLFFEESGDFKVGTVLSQAGEAYQVEMASGKRTKVKVKDVLLQYEKPAPAELLEQAKAVAAEIDLDFLWEVAGEDEFGFAELGAEYFGHAPLPPEAAGLILALHSAPVYFYKKGRGRYKAAPEASLKAALAGIEKKKQQALVQAGYVEELKAEPLARLDAAHGAATAVQAGQEHHRIQGAGSGLHGVAHDAAAPDAGRRRHCFAERLAPVEVPVREFPERRRLPERARAVRDGQAAAGRRGRLLDRRRDHDRDRRCLLRAAAGRWHRESRYPHRRAGPGHPPGRRDRQDGAPAHVDRLHAGRQDHHAAGRNRQRVHAGGRHDLPGAVAVRHAGPESGLGRGQHADARRTGADRQQPAPQRARRPGQRGNPGQRRGRVSAQGRLGRAVAMGAAAGSRAA